MRLALCALAVAVIAAGCSRAPVARVYVDLERVAASDPLVLPTTYPSAIAPAPVAPTTATLDALPARRLDLSENKGRLAKVQAAVEEARDRTVRDVARKLRTAYQKEIDSIEANRMSEVPPIREAALAKAWAQVRTRFMAYADKRAPQALTIGLYAGFPDPDPNSVRAPDPKEKAIYQHFEKTRAARAQLVDLEADYEHDVRQMLAGYDDEVASAITDIRVEIEKMRADAETRAIADARAQVAVKTAQIESVLSGKAEVDLPARPSATAVTPGASPVLSEPRVPLPDRADLMRRRLEAVRSDARIWAGQVGVELVDSTGSVDDRTLEFIAWRKKRQTGP